MFLLKTFIFLTTILDAFASEKVTLYWNERTPYMSYDNNELKGLTGSTAYKAFIDSKIPFKLFKASTKRQLQNIKLNKEKVCAIGWYKLKERVLHISQNHSIKMGLS